MSKKKFVYPYNTSPPGRINTLARECIEIRRSPWLLKLLKIYRYILANSRYLGNLLPRRNSSVIKLMDRKNPHDVNGFQYSLRCDLTFGGVRRWDIGSEVHAGTAVDGKRMVLYHALARYEFRGESHSLNTTRKNLVGIFYSFALLRIWGKDYGPSKVGINFLQYSSTLV